MANLHKDQSGLEAGEVRLDNGVVISADRVTMPNRYSNGGATARLRPLDNDKQDRAGYIHCRDPNTDRTLYISASDLGGIQVKSKGEVGEGGCLPLLIAGVGIGTAAVNANNIADYVKPITDKVAQTITDTAPKVMELTEMLVNYVL